MRVLDKKIFGKLSGPDSEPVSVDWGGVLLTEARRAWRGLEEGRQLASSLEARLAYHLATIGPGTEGGSGWIPQYRVETTEYSVDFGLREWRVGVEVDGPSHFARNTSAFSCLHFILFYFICLFFCFVSVFFKCGFVLFSFFLSFFLFVLGLISCLLSCYEDLKSFVLIAVI
jgi:hypothetical protein